MQPEESELDDENNDDSTAVARHRSEDLLFYAIFIPRDYGH